MRLLQIDPTEYQKLDADDECYYIGEYTSGGTYRASETNQLIHNLKKKPSVPEAQLRYKRQAIQQAANQLRTVLRLDVVAQRFTIVPAPCSKLATDPEYDDRMFQVVNVLRAMEPRLDVRRLVIATSVRPSQHEGNRLSVGEIEASMGIDNGSLNPQLKRAVMIVDDVFTMGGTFKAMQRHVSKLPGVETVFGVFLAKTVWPALDPASVFSIADEF
jgi:predicted amidophosphoribosyltransferase